MHGDTVEKRIYEIRRELRQTQKEFAAELGVEPIQVSRWERGASVPRLGRLSHIAALGNMTLAEFFDGVAA